jgi:type IV pilus assembly protein PilV
MLIGEKIMYKLKISSLESAQQGAVLLEAMIAILIFSMGVLAIVGLQAAMIKNTSDSKYRADASYIAQKMIGQIWSAPDTLPADPSTTVTAITDLLPGGSVSITRAGAQFTATVTWQQPGTGQVQHNFITTAQVAGF